MPENSTQQFLEIEEIREGVVVLKNKSLRGVLMVSSQNFALKSEDEQQATIYQFQNFLNSLDFSLEIVVQSRILNITGYLDKLASMEKEQQNELLKIQTAEYRKFISEIIAGGQILSKTFFAIIPFPIVEIPGLGGRKSSVPGEDQFQRAKFQLWQRMEFLAAGLRRCGLQCTPLSTPELIELFWGLYHPEEAEVGYYPEIPPEILK
jgi:hypothetical protein